MEDQIKIGRQIYVVYPLIEESKKMDLKNLEDGLESICRYLGLKTIQLEFCMEK